MSVAGGVRDGGPGPLPRGLSREGLVDEVRRALASVPDGAVVVVAVSGGPDSTALAYLTTEARPDLDVVLAHVRHGARDDEADVAAVSAHAAAIGVDLRVEAVTVERDGEGWEAAAREARYEALGRIADAVGSAHILLGHTAEDQAETVILRAARGTGLDGLAGMAPVRIDDGHILLRPLLRVRRDDVRRFVELEGLEAVEDPTNRDPRFRRVRVRESVLPVLDGVAPDPVAALARLADLARDDAAALDAVVATRASRVVRRYGPVRAVATEELGRIDTGLARRLVRHLLDDVRATWAPVDAVHVETILCLEPGSAVDVPGATVSCAGGWIAVRPSDASSGEEVPLEIPGRTSWPAAGLDVVATSAAEEPGGQLVLEVVPAGRGGRVPDADDLVPPGGDPALASVLLPVLDGSIVMRAWRDGDRLRTAAGTKKLQDLFVDAGVPRVIRDLVPVVCCDERVVWVAGVAANAEVMAAAREQPHVRLVLEKSL